MKKRRKKGGERWKKRDKEGERVKTSVKRGEKNGKRPHITGPLLFFYEEKLTVMWALSKMKINVIYIL